jgi:hypothetical protein
VPEPDLTRREALAGAAGLALGSGLIAATPSAARTKLAPAQPLKPVIPLPSPAQVRADFQRMVDFGPRLTGSAGHNAYIAWLERELVAAGVQLMPCSSYETTRWSVGDYGLDILDGSSRGPVKIAAYYPRSLETPAAGIEGPLVYGGTAPLPSFNVDDLASVVAGIKSYPAELLQWASDLPSLVKGQLTRNSVMVVDVPLPLPLTTAIFPALATYLQWQGHSIVDWLVDDYKRNWVLPGLGVPLAPFQALGAKAVVLILDSSYEALQGAYIPFVHGFEPIPALYVDRDTGNHLRALAAGTPRARLTLTATRAKVRTPSIVGVLPGASEESVILNTHTDGEGFVEENCGVCIVQLARHFGSLPPGQRLKRTIVFSLFTGHMDPELPETQGFIDDNPKLIENAAAALTIEHFGCTEWIDDTASGYHAAGRPEALGVWTTQGPMFETTRAALEASGLQRVALLRPPVQFGVGPAFQSAGVPQIGAIAGPTYLLNISESGDMEKLDESLAAKQIAWIADLMWRLESVSKAALRTGDLTLGKSTPAAPGTGGIGFMYATCGLAPVTEKQRLIIHVGHPGANAKRLKLSMRASTGAYHGLRVELKRRGVVIASTSVPELGTTARQLVLHSRRREGFAPGRYELGVSDRAQLLASRVLLLRARRRSRA